MFVWHLSTSSFKWGCLLGGTDRTNSQLCGPKDWGIPAGKTTRDKLLFEDLHHELRLNLIQLLQRRL
jgi:hypothetical protein